ncbi:MAG: DMT family transporter [Bryobacteraceae bacterium]|nr:DMT family transporter [Bryobacteraceae bacterium]
MQSEDGESHGSLYALILLLIFIWSANFVIGKFALREIPALLVIGLRMVISGATMIPIYLRHKHKTGTRGWTREDVPLLLGLGLLGVGLNQVFFVTGLSKTSVAHAALMIGLTPISVLMLAALAGQERLNPIRLAGMGLALTGIAVLQFGPGSQKSGNLWGDALVFCGGFVFAAFTVIGKATMGRVGGIVVNTFAYVGTGLALLPMTIYLSRDFPFHSVSMTAWASLLYMAFCPSVIGYLIYYHALSRIPASKLSTFTYMQPLLATLMAIPALGEHPTSSLAFGGIMILAGVFVAERLQ